MKYFTRELHEALQSAANEPDEKSAAALRRRAKRDWDKAQYRYDRHLRAIQGALTPDVAQLSRTNMHDARVTRSFFSEPSVLSLNIDGSDAPWLECRDLQLVFTGVTIATPPAEYEGDTLLYDEIDIEGDGLMFQYRALLERSELCVSFARVKLARVASRP